MLEQEAYISNGGVTEETVAKWKKEHGRVWELDVPVRDKVHRGYLRKMKRHEFSRASTFISRDEPYKLGEYALENCWLGGDEEILNDEDLFIGAAFQAGQIFDFPKGTIQEV